MAIYVLGISAFYHDSAAALVKDGVPVAVAQEERFTRVLSVTVRERRGAVHRRYRRMALDHQEPDHRCFK